VKSYALDWNSGLEIISTKLIPNHIEYVKNDILPLNPNKTIKSLMRNFNDINTMIDHFPKPNNLEDDITQD